VNDGAATIGTEEAARRLGVSRDTLERMLAEAPRGLPGGPRNCGVVGGRRRLKWYPDRLREWFDAYGAWRDREDARRAPGAKRTRPLRLGASPSGTGKITLAELRALRQGR